MGSGGGFIDRGLQCESLSASSSFSEQYRLLIEGGAIRVCEFCWEVLPTQTLRKTQTTLANGAGAVYLANSPINLWELYLFGELNPRPIIMGARVKLSASSAKFF